VTKHQNTSLSQQNPAKELKSSIMVQVALAARKQPKLNQKPRRPKSEKLEMLRNSNEYEIWQNKTRSFCFVEKQ